jgi:hypothetical protein
MFPTFTKTTIHFDRKPSLKTFEIGMNPLVYALDLLWESQQFTLFFRSANPETLETIEELIECLQKLKTTLKVG